MKILEVVDSKLKNRIKNAIDNLDDSNPDDQKLLHYLKSNLFSGNIPKALANSGLSKKVRYEAFNWWANLLENTKVPLEDKIYLIKLMSNPENLIPASAYHQNERGSLLTKLSPKITNNSAFKATIGPTWSFKIGGPTGMGPGELALILFSQNAKESSGKKGGDFEVDGWVVELKSGGAVPPGSSGKKVVDALNDNLEALSKKAGFYDQLDMSVLNPSFDGGWLPQFFQLYTQSAGLQRSHQLFTKYLKTIYEPIDQGLIDTMWSQLGQPGTNRLLIPLIFNMYKASHGWDALLFADKGNFNSMVVVDANGFPPDMKFKLVLRQKGNTYAVADGSFIVGKGETATKTAKVPKPKTPKATKPPKAAPAPTPAQAAQAPAEPGEPMGPEPTEPVAEQLQRIQQLVKHR